MFSLMSCRRDASIGRLVMRENVVQSSRPTPTRQVTRPGNTKPVSDDEPLDESLPEPTAIVTLAPTPTRAVPDTTAVYYTVGVGDTLSRIAMLHGTTVESLMQINQLSNANQVKIGQQLQVSYNA